MELKHILHPTDFSESARPAFDRAVYLCEKSGAELHLLHVTETFGSDPIRGAFDSRLDEESFQASIFSRADERMKQLLTEAEARNIPVKRIHSQGQAPAQIILDYAADQAPDLIVVGTHGRRGFRRMVAGSVAMEIVRRAEAPVMTVPARMRRSDGVSLKRILVPVDFSEHARTALGYARALTDLTDASLHALHVIEKPVFPAFYDASVEMMYGNAESMVEEARLELERLNASIDSLDIRCSTEAVQGHAVEAILDTARARQVDLIVLSTHGLTGVSRFFLGSVSERVIRIAPVPTLRIRTIPPPTDQDGMALETEANSGARP